MAEIAGPIAPAPSPPLADTSVLDLLARRTHTTPDAVACHHVVSRDGELTSLPMTFAELDERVDQARARLAVAAVGPGDRVVLSLQDPHLFLVWFFATLGSGAIAVPLPPAGARLPQAFNERVRGVCADCRPAVVVAESPEDCREAAGSGLPAEAFLDADELAGDVPPSAAATPPDPFQPAILQYTSGSTRVPKGVVVTHHNVVANLAAIARAAAMTPRDAMLSWLPLHHDMGLFGGLLLPICHGMGSYAMTPLTFVKGPARWLEAISRFGITLTVGPPSTYGLCLRLLGSSQGGDLDLSSLRLAIAGAEPIDPAIPRGFAERLPAFGVDRPVFYPVYGLAEATLAVAFPPPGRPVLEDVVDRDHLARTGWATAPTSSTARTSTFVSVGCAFPEHGIQIREPATSRECAEREVGEVVVTGPSMAPRYFNEDADRDECRTGDLGYVADGELYVIGRLKDLIVVGGQNFHPADIEAALTNLSDAPPLHVAAFAVERAGGTDGLAIAWEVLDPTEVDRSAVEGQIIQIVHEQFGLTPRAVLVVPRGALPVTTSGKIQRQACRRLFESGALSEA